MVSGWLTGAIIAASSAEAAFELPLGGGPAAATSDRRAAGGLDEGDGVDKSMRARR